LSEHDSNVDAEVDEDEDETTANADGDVEEEEQDENSTISIDEMASHSRKSVTKPCWESRSAQSRPSSTRATAPLEEEAMKS